MVTGGSSQPHSQNPTLIMARTKKTAAPASSTATIGFEAKLWLTADKLRNNMDAAEYKHVVLGLKGRISRPVGRRRNGIAFHPLT